MSHRPHWFSPYSPTFVVRSLLGPLSVVPYGKFPMQFACLPFSSEPKENSVVVPARQAYSHSASVGNRNLRFCLSFSVSFLQKAWASSHETQSTGNCLVSKSFTLSAPPPSVQNQ